MKKLLSIALATILLISQMLFTVGHANIVVQEIWDSENLEIVRVYQLADGENSERISREAFTRNGIQFEFAGIIGTPVYSTQEYSKTVTVYTQSRDLEAIMRELAAEMYFEYYGYYGVLTLNLDNINIQSRGTRSSSHTITRIREFPHLSNADMYYVPRTITENGRTFQLSNVEWRTQNTTTVDYTVLPSTFTAIATYTGTETRTHNIGYTTTVEYRGIISRQTGATQYTVYFAGTPVRNRVSIIIVIAVVLIIIALIAYFARRRNA